MTSGFRLSSKHKFMLFKVKLNKTQIHFFSFESDLKSSPGTQQTGSDPDDALVSPGADPHEGDGGAGEEDRHEEEGLPAPDV